MTKNSDEEFFLVPMGDDAVLAVPVARHEEASHAVNVEALIHAVGPLLGAVLKDSRSFGAALYELSPESQRMMRDARRNYTGNYFRGVLRDTKGHTKHQLQLREISPAQEPAAFDAVVAVQMAAIQAQLTRIEDTLAELATSVSRVVGFLEVQQRSQVEAALDVLRELHDRARVTGQITERDWSRLSGIELILNTQVRAVEHELAARLGDKKFGRAPKLDAKQLRDIDSDRVAGLMDLHRLLIGGLRGWNELLALRKYRDEELTEAEAAAILDRLTRLQDEHDRALGLLTSVIGATENTNKRSWAQRLLVDGILVGRRNDEKYAAQISSNRLRLREIERSARPALSLLGQSLELAESGAPPDEQVLIQADSE